MRTWRGESVTSVSCIERSDLKKTAFHWMPASQQESRKAVYLPASAFSLYFLSALDLPTYNSHRVIRVSSNRPLHSMEAHFSRPASNGPNLVLGWIRHFHAISGRWMQGCALEYDVRTQLCVGISASRSTLPKQTSCPSLLPAALLRPRTQAAAAHHASLSCFHLTRLAQSRAPDFSESHAQPLFVQPSSSPFPNLFKDVLRCVFVFSRPFSGARRAPVALLVGRVWSRASSRSCGRLRPSIKEGSAPNDFAPAFVLLIRTFSMPRWSYRDSIRHSRPNLSLHSLVDWLP
jgi:hypothetical protein